MPRTITDIIPPSRRRQMEESRPAMDMDAGTPPPPPPMRPSEYKRPKKRFPYMLAGIALLVIALSVGAIYAFAGVKVTIAPRVDTTTVSGEFSATASAGDLPFEVITVDQTATQSVPAEGTEQADVPAQGTITVYNEQAKVQELIKNTRFETSDGLIYRIHDSVKVPAGTASAPGTLDVTVYADAGGAKYNVGPSSFTLPGLKGSALFDQVYARSSGSMTGGFTGTRPSVGEATRSAKMTAMQSGLESGLRAAIAEKIPDGYILVPGSIAISYAPQPDGAGTSSTVAITEKGSAIAVIFPKVALGRALAYRVVAQYAGQDIAVDDASGLTLTPDADQAIVAGMQSLSFTLSGNVNLDWVVDSSKVASAIAGKSRDSAKAILNGFPEIGKATLVLRPFWESTLPADPAELKVVVEAPKASGK